MISHKHKCIFIHIPKCAGTSIESALGHLDDHVGRDGQDHRSLRMLQRPFVTWSALRSKENIVEVLRGNKHRYVNKTRNPRNKFTVTKSQYNSYYKFTVVRNPWERAFSWYKNVLRDDIHLEKYGLTSEVSFSQFLSEFAGKGMLRSQLYWIKGFDGSVPLDYIARFETLSVDVASIFNILNIRNYSLPHEIAGDRSDFREFYDEETHEIITKVYKDDIDMFGYKF